MFSAQLIVSKQQTMPDKKRKILRAKNGAQDDKCKR